MRDFFLTTLNNLDKVTGNRQLEKLMAMPDPKKEVNELLDVLCKVCNRFDYIPDADKQRIVEESILSDPEFFGLNGKIIFKWLSKACGVYYKEAVEEPRKIEGDPTPLTGEARQKMLDEWLKSLKKMDESVKIEYNGSKLKATLSELPAMDGYVKPGAEQLLLHDLHIEYLKENYHPVTRQPLPGWLSEDEWLRKNEF